MIKIYPEKVQQCYKREQILDLDLDTNLLKQTSTEGYPFSAEFSGMGRILSSTIQ